MLTENWPQAALEPGLPDPAVNICSAGFFNHWVTLLVVAAADAAISSHHGIKYIYKFVYQYFSITNHRNSAV